MKVVMKKIGDIKPYEKNPRNNDEAVELVANSIKEFGWKQPIVVDKKGVIIAGHTRYKAALQLGLDEVPVLVADDLTAKQVKAYRLADNKVGEAAIWDFDLLDDELGELAGEIDMSNFGFADDVKSEDFGTEFELPNENVKEFRQMTFTLHEEQYQAIEEAIKNVKECRETFGNENRNGNALYEVVMQWAEQRK